MTNPEINNDIPQRAVSLYGQNDGVEDFPVLKAFQQYIDAEQEKARKRIVMLGIFFGAILVVVVAVFMFLLHGINMRNQTLSDRLVEYAMKETERRATATQPVQQPSTENAEALKAVTATLAALQESIRKNSEETTQPVKSEAETKIERAKALLEAEKKQLAEERERLHQIEVDRQRRKLYPELYESENATQRARASTQGRSGARMLTDEDIREILREAYSADQDKELKPSSKPAAKADEKKASGKDVDPDDVSEESAIEYFKDDEYSIPVDVKGSSKQLNFTVPVE